MIKLTDFNSCRVVTRVNYGGDAGAKIAVVFGDRIWMLKYPKNTRDYVNPQISYTTSPLSEYLGSKIYEALGIPVHETMLGIHGNKIVAACKDFTRGEDGLLQEKTLAPFHDLKNSFMSTDLESYSGTGSETLLDEVLAAIAGHDELKKIPGVLERFWDMFVTDAFIGNNDRNNGNWGILFGIRDDAVSLAPVFDNGNAFFNKRSLAQMEKRMKDENAMVDDAYKNYLCAFKYAGLDKEGQKINPFTFIARGENPDCAAAVSRFVNAVDMKKIEEIIYEIPETFGAFSVMPEIQKEFYLELMRIRLEKISEAIPLKRIR